MLTTPAVRNAVTSSAAPGVTFTECPVDSPADDDVRATAYGFAWENTIIAYLPGAKSSKAICPEGSPCLKATIRRRESCKPTVSGLGSASSPGLLMDNLRLPIGS